MRPPEVSGAPPRGAEARGPPRPPPYLGVGPAGMQWTFHVETDSLDSVANRGTSSDSRGKDIP